VFQPAEDQRDNWKTYVEKLRPLGINFIDVEFYTYFRVLKRASGATDLLGTEWQGTAVTVIRDVLWVADALNPPTVDTDLPWNHEPEYTGTTDYVKNIDYAVDVGPAPNAGINWAGGAFNEPTTGNHYWVCAVASGNYTP